MVLLIVDVQRAFVNRYTRHIPAIVESLQTEYSHVFASRFVNRAGSPWRRWMDWNGCNAGTSEADLAFDAAPRTAVFEKTGYSAAGRALLKDLADIGEHEIAVCGMDTDACVLATALDLFSAGVRPVVLTRRVQQLRRPRTPPRRAPPSRAFARTRPARRRETVDGCYATTRARRRGKHLQHEGPQWTNGSRGTAAAPRQRRGSTIIQSRPRGGSPAVRDRGRPRLHRVPGGESRRTAPSRTPRKEPMIKCGENRTRASIDPGRPAIEYLTLDRPRFYIDTWPDLDDGSWCIDTPGLYVTCRICGIPAANLVYGGNLWETEPEKLWGLDWPRGGWFGTYAIGDIEEPGTYPWTWNDMMAAIRDRLSKTSLAGAVTDHWYDLEVDDDTASADEQAGPRQRTPAPEARSSGADAQSGEEHETLYD